MPAYLSPIGNEQQSDASGNPLAGGFIFTYLAGTSTPAATFTDASAAIPQANPIVLNASGLPASPIYINGGQSMKFVIQNSASVLQRTIDNIEGVNDPTFTNVIDQWVFYSGTPTYIGATSFSLIGDQTLIFQINRRIRTTNAGGFIYSRISNATFGSGITTVAVVNDSGALDVGLSAVSYGLLSATNPSIPETSLGSTFRTSQTVSASDISRQNAIINGGFSINQRAYVSGAATVAGQYTLDRWKVTGAGGITFSTTANKTTVTIPGAQQLQQVVEGVNLQTATYVLSWEGTAQGKIGGGSFGASGAVTSAITGGTNTTIEFNTGTVTNVKLEIGTAATPFVARSIPDELALCKRYYQLLTGFVGTAINATSAMVGCAFPVVMRATPTAGQTAVITLTDTAASYTQSAISASLIGNESGGRVTLSNYTGMTALRTVIDGSATGRITLSAEL